MPSRFQAAQLVASPLYPNAIAWSDENLIAVACGHLVTILNPALTLGPRGLITIPTCEPYPIGLVKKEDLLAGCLLPNALSRDRRPCVRSISWSPLGMAPNFGCLLAVCTTEGRVKLYRSPFCDFCAEWIEVIDISDRLYDFLAKTNFGQSEILDSEIVHEQTTQVRLSDNLADVFPNTITGKGHKRRRASTTNGIDKESETFGGQLIGNGEKLHAGSSPHTNTREEQLPKITADQYASRSQMLSSIVVAWSPVLCLTSKICTAPQNDSPHRFSIFAVGGKAGKISIWRIHAPQCYSIEHNRVSPGVMLVGLLQAHNSWVTAVNLALLSSNSNHQVLLASASSDGSVKIWLGNGEKLLESSESDNAPFVLLKEVIFGNIVPVSVLSLVIPVQAPYKILLAVGKGSGSFEVWTCDISSCKFDKACSQDAHDYVVTGLAWAFDGCCLYSCGQDNYVRSWLLHGSSLCEVSIPSCTPGLRSSTDLPDVFFSCLGVAVSPGNLVVAMVRNLDVDQLDHMYEGRAQKAIVEFFWIGGQNLNMLFNTSQDFVKESFHGFSQSELLYWESNILWSLKNFESPDKPLVIWDIIASLLAFKQFMPEYVDRILASWLSMSYLGSHMDLSINEVLTHISDNLSKITSRQLHILNIICRCLVLSMLKADEINSKLNFEEQTSAAGEQQTLWIKLLFRSEKELRERLLVFSFSSFLAKNFIETGYWHPVGIAQMEQWVELNRDHVNDQLNVLTSEVQKHKSRLSSNKFEVEERCSYCSASVPFNSPEIAFCQGLESSNRDMQNHKLVRCAVSMQVCPATPLWHCKCCNRWASKLAPETLFTKPGYPVDFKPLTEACVEELSKPLCPFCGILLQRLQPDFLLSASPV
ncbi:hypothetical protein P3X46_033911 [Hevea brasiliensis]|uniref:Transcription factor IIIC 90kDa subunit N-terminal domain-containing protein n=1 Tax=Hevea brasiliensis TaxID=3981 RepID=A0ABQ9KBK7_HEVBR|nr:uncharacterized protein LOC110658617 [Hevea brasiliensis]KAJ9130947.1 hypothetical protein P3X46_033911 [Hevea brasiliensis]